MTKDEDKDKDKKYVIGWRTYYLQSAPHSKIVDLDLPKDILDCEGKVSGFITSLIHIVNKHVKFKNCRHRNR